MARFRFDEVCIRATRVRKDAETGKRRQESRKFWQTINPFNRMPDGRVKTRDDILDELRAERDAWLAEQPKGTTP